MIIIILAMLFSVPLFDVNSYINPPSDYEFGLLVLEKFYYSNDSNHNNSFNNAY